MGEFEHKETVSRLLVNISEEGPYTNPWANSIYNAYIQFRREAAGDICKLIEEHYQIEQRSKVLEGVDEFEQPRTSEQALWDVLLIIRERYGVDDA